MNRENKIKSTVNDLDRVVCSRLGIVRFIRLIECYYNYFMPL